MRCIADRGREDMLKNLGISYLKYRHRRVGYSGREKCVIRWVKGCDSEDMLKRVKSLGMSTV